MTLKEHIDAIRDALRRNLFINEAAVSQGIVIRLLDALGWPTFNPQEIFPEYPVEGGRVDYALCPRAKESVIFIEVKQGGQSDGAEWQLLRYAFQAGVPIAILTDGRKWQFFYPIGQGNYEKRRVYTLDLIETDDEESVRILNRYLNYELVCNGDAAKAIEEDYRKVSEDIQIKENLPEAWNDLMEEKDEILLDLVAEKVESLCGYKPTGTQVWNFLKSLEYKTVVNPPTLGGESGGGRKKGPQGKNQLKAYLIPVIQLMRDGKSHVEAFKNVSKEQKVEHNTVQDACTRKLRLTTREFREHVKSGQIVQVLIDKYSQQRELITRELG